MGKGKKERGREERRKGIDFAWRTSQGQFWIHCSIFLHKSLRITIVGRSEETVIQKKDTSFTSNLIYLDGCWRHTET